jgi:hypothetical protein
MANEPPFDVWDGEELPSTDGAAEAFPAEEEAMHIDPDSVMDDATPHWSELTEETANETPDDRPVTYFPDEQPERRPPTKVKDEREPDLEELLERQHYSFPRKG